MFNRAGNFVALAIAFFLVVARAEAEPGIRVSTPPLGMGIAFEEVDEDQIAHPLVSASDIYKIDLNSTLIIHLDPREIADSIPVVDLRRDRSVVLPDPSEDPATRQLISALKDLNDYLSASKEIAGQYQIYSTKAIIPGFKGLLKKQGEARRALRGSIRAYLLASRTKGVDGAQSVDAQWNDLFEGADWTTSVGGFIRGETKRKDSESDQQLRDIQKRSKQFTLSVAARLIRAGMPVGGPLHLPGYDSRAEGAYKPIDKITFSMNKEDQAALEGERKVEKSVTDELNKTSSIREALHSTVADIVRDSEQRERVFQQETDRAVNDVQTLITQRLTASAQAEAGTLSAPFTAGLTQMDDQVQIQLAAIKSFQRDSAAALPSLAALAATTAGQDPVAALDATIGLANDARGKISSGFAALQSQTATFSATTTVMLRNLERSAADLDSRLQGTAKAEVTNETALQKAIIARLEAFRTSQIDPYVQYFQTLSESGGSLRGAASDGLKISKGLDSSLVDDKTIFHQFEQIVDTKLPIARTDRAAGDTIELHIVADPTDPEGNRISTAPAIAEREAVFQVVKFGGYSEFSTGAAAFFNADPGRRQAEFGALATWVVHSRSRDREWWNILNPGLGIHTAGISTGLGVGASLHFFPGNLLQLGGGTTLRSTGDNRWYWFVGVRLINFKLPTVN